MRGALPTVCHWLGWIYFTGWVLWKDESLLHKDLIFELHYLGSTEYSYTLNFSRPSAPILGGLPLSLRDLFRCLALNAVVSSSFPAAQMFNFLNLGFQGYRSIAQAGEYICYLCFDICVDLNMWVDLTNARMLSRALEASTYFTVRSLP